ncbi:MAG TPA: signal peptidase I [Verrucomicrobiae bacterium]|nr:signal peptidase I [Verrucomicrobiae bacterium]
MSNSNAVRRSAEYLWREWLRPAILIAAVIFPLKSAVADWNWVPSGSMKPTILEGDLVLVNKLAYDLKFPFTLWRLASWNKPRRGDIVVFFSPKDGTRLVKRVMAGPGDTIEVRNNVVFLNGQRLNYEIRKEHPFGHEIFEDDSAIIAQEQSSDGAHWVMALPARMARRDYPLTTIAAGKYFMMGDSRDNSFDSRYYGLVDQKKIVGRVKRVILSFDKNHHYIPRLKRSFSEI